MSTSRRAHHGTTIWKQDKAFPGYTLFTPMLINKKQMQGQKESKIYLLDMQGNIVHYWTVPGMVKLHGELLENGNIICSVEEFGAARPVKTAFCVSSILELDWDSNIVWKYTDPDHMIDCHDRARLKNGNTLFMKYKALPSAIASKVQGGMPGTETIGVVGKANDDDFGHRVAEGAEKTGTMYTLVFTEVNPAGEIVWEMPVNEALDYDTDQIIAYGGRELWPGLNSIEEMPDGNLMSTSYNLSTVYIWDRETKTVKWRFGGQGNNRISYPHDPTVLKNGNIMLFDNGRYYSSDPGAQQTNYFPPDFSRVIEINPKTNQVEWEYTADNPVDFYATYISSARRQPNGNTLICEGSMGRFFEVTSKGEIVWEYVSPFYTESKSRFGYTNAVFRCMRYDVDYPGLKGKVFDEKKTQLLNGLYSTKALAFGNNPSR